MTDESTSRAVAVAEPRAQSRHVSLFSDETAFESAQRMALALVSSPLVPSGYQGKENMGSALIAMDMANRMGLGPLAVMQNLDIIEGRPSWRSTFIIGALNSCGLFSPLRFEVEDRGEREVSYQTWGEERGSKVTKKVVLRDLVYTAWATERGTGEILKGPPVSIGMAVAEGWYFRKGSKWPTMPELMLSYRCAAFFGRLYAPHILNGMPMADEVEDMRDVTPPKASAASTDGEPRPEGRASGVHAAMQRGKAEAPKAATIEHEPPAKAAPRQAKPKPAPEPEPDVEDAREPGDERGAAGDMFDDPYEPA